MMRRAQRNWRKAADISRVLYPNDDTDAGKILRLKQEYFFSAAAIADLMKKHKAKFTTLDNFMKNAIQLNDTHPCYSTSEFIRKMITEEELYVQKAYTIAKKTFAYTNHTIMAEALESGTQT